MSFDGALGHMQVPSDLGVVASLEQQLNNLLFPGSDLGELLLCCHLYLSEMCASVAASGAKTKPLGTSGIQSLRLILQTAGQNSRFYVNPA